jgi:hypothetical protein
MADKEKEKEPQYVVTADFLGTLTRGDIRTADGLPSDPDALLKDGSIRRARASETKDGATWVDEPDAGFEERAQALAAEAAKAPKTEAATTPTTTTTTATAPSTGATKSPEVTHHG